MDSCVTFGEVKVVEDDDDAREFLSLSSSTFTFIFFQPLVGL